MKRRYATYRPIRRLSRWRRRLRFLRPFRGVRLNAVGWSAVALLGLAGAAAGFGAAVLVGWPTAPAAVVGALACLAAPVVADRRRWGALETGYSWGSDPATVHRVGDDLRRQGLPVKVGVDVSGRSILRYRNRDARRVRSALARAGVSHRPL